MKWRHVLRNAKRERRKANKKLTKRKINLNREWIEMNYPSGKGARRLRRKKNQKF